MCGIIGYVGKENAKDVIISGLHALEYRGYDSSGIAYNTHNKIKIVKMEGKVANLEKKLKEDGILSDEDEDALKIEHIRWSRFHFINHWSYAEKRDNEKRKHNLLVPYEKLSDAEKAKDYIKG